MAPKTVEITLETLAGGAIPERFAHAWQQVLENIEDPNTEPGTVREVTIKVQVKALDRAREQLDSRVTVATKLAPAAPVKTSLYMAQRGGKLLAVGFDPHQKEMFEETDPGVRPIRQAQAH